MIKIDNDDDDDDDDLLDHCVADWQTAQEEGNHQHYHEEVVGLGRFVWNLGRVGVIHGRQLKTNIFLNCQIQSKCISHVFLQKENNTRADQKDF